MSHFFQNLLVFLIVAGSLSFVVRQGFLSLRGRKSKLGGCGSCGSCGTKTTTASTKPSERVVFLPVEMLTRRSRKP